MKNLDFNRGTIMDEKKLDLHWEGIIDEKKDEILVKRALMDEKIGF